MTRIVHSSVLVLIVGFALFLSPQARANYEYRCGAHRNAMCHAEPRAEQSGASGNCYGRCGPGCGWSALGNAYTGACANHDSCVRGKLNAGAGSWNAHSGCAGSLPAAVGSFFQTHWNNGFQWAGDTLSGFWKKIKGCCN